MILSVSSLKNRNLIFLILFFILNLIPSSIAHAQWPVFDVPTEIGTGVSAVANGSTIAKEYGLDGLAWFAANIALKKITAQTVNWINSGFKGSPAYVTNPSQFFLNVADQTAGRVLSSPALNKVCTPFNAQVRIALVKNYLNEPYGNYSCNLRVLKNNYEQFMQDFSQGGWDGWLEMTQVDANNPYGAYIQAQSSLYAQLSAQNNKYLQQLQQGRGFLSFERCEEGYEVTQAQIDAHAEEGDASPYAGYSAGDCFDNKTKVVTPGSVIENQLNQVVGSGNRRLEAADEIDEIIGALFSQFLGKVVGGVTGLFGTSQPSSGSPSLTSQLFNEKEKGSSNPGNRVTCTTAPDTVDESGNVIPGATNCDMNNPPPPQPTTGGNSVPPVYCTNDGSGNMTCSGNPPPKACSALGQQEQDYMLPLLNSGTDPHQVVNMTNQKFNLPYGSQAVWYPPEDHGGIETIGLPEFYLAKDGPNGTWTVTLRCNAGGGGGGGGGGTPSVEPQSLFDQVAAARARYGEHLTEQELGDLLASVAGANSGWGLLRKIPGSSGCNTSNGFVSCDILFHSPTCTMYDVLIDSDPLVGKAAPTWSFAGIGNRNDWVDVGAGGAGTGPCATLVGAGGTSGGPAAANLQSDLEVERSKYGATLSSAEIGAILNTVAWNHKDEGWGMLFKNYGTYCDSPAGPISCDILYHKPSNTIYDVFIAADPNTGKVTPTWNNKGANTSGRAFIAPVQP